MYIVSFVVVVGVPSNVLLGNVSLFSFTFISPLFFLVSPLCSWALFFLLFFFLPLHLPAIIKNTYCSISQYRCVPLSPLLLRLILQKNALKALLLRLAMEYSLCQSRIKYSLCQSRILQKNKEKTILLSRICF
jgi:hypothetical protein